MLIGCAALVVFGAGAGLNRRRWGWLDCAAGAATLGVVYASTRSRLIVQGAGDGRRSAAPRSARHRPAGLGALVAIGAGLTIGRVRDVGDEARLSAPRTSPS